MAKIKQGVLGGFSGSIGNVTGSSWKGIAVMKSKPLSVSNPRTDGQVGQRNSFKNAASLFSVLLASVIKPVYNPTASKMSGYNLACSLNKQAFNAAGVFNPEKCSIGNGSLTNVSNVAIDGAIVGGSIDITFSSNVPLLSPRLTDKIYAWAIEPISGNVYASLTPSTRADESISLSLVSGNGTWEGNRTVYAFVSGTSLDGRQTFSRSNKQELVAAMA
jgi:hypothetical protein